MGTLMVLVFLTQTIIAVTEQATRGATSTLAAFSMIPSDWQLWLAAGETAAWRLKWVMIPLTLLVVFLGRKLYLSVQQSPARFCGQRYARHGFAASLAVPALILILIGVTVPARLTNRQLAIEAGRNAHIHRTDRALDEYREKFATLPTTLKDLGRLPDADGSLAAALKSINAAGYTPNSEVAAVPTTKPQPLRGAVILKASAAPANDEMMSGGISFTNYELRFPGADKLMNTDDDLIVLDGVTFTDSDLPRRGVGATSAAQKRQP